MERISTRWPVLRIGVLVLAFVMLVVMGATSKPGVHPAFFAVVGLANVIIWWLRDAPLAVVYEVSDGLIVSRWGRRAHVPFAQIAEVIAGTRVTLVLREPCALGMRIRFIPARARIAEHLCRRLPGVAPVAPSTSTQLSDRWTLAYQLGIPLLFVGMATYAFADGYQATVLTGKDLLSVVLIGLVMSVAFWWFTIGRMAVVTETADGLVVKHLWRQATVPFRQIKEVADHVPFVPQQALVLTLTAPCAIGHCVVFLPAHAAVADGLRARVANTGSVSTSSRAVRRAADRSRG